MQFFHHGNYCFVNVETSALHLHKTWKIRAPSTDATRTLRVDAALQRTQSLFLAFLRVHFVFLRVHCVFLSALCVSVVQVFGDIFPATFPRARQQRYTERDESVLQNLQHNLRRPQNICSQIGFETRFKRK